MNVQLQVVVSVDESMVEALAQLIIPVVLRSLPPRLPPVVEVRPTPPIPVPLKVPADESALLINTKQLAKMLDVSARTLSRMIQTGEIPRPVRIGRTVRWNIDVVKRWLEEGCPRNWRDNRFKTR